MSDINAKIQKLLALSENNASDAEAKAAFAKAQDLIAQHGYDEPREEYVMGHDYAYARPSRKCNWKLNIGLAAGYASGCKPIISNNSVCWVGDEGDVKTARIMFNYLIVTLDRLTTNLKGSGRGYIAGYRLGFSTEVLNAARMKYNELREDKIDTKVTDHYQEGLVLLDNKIDTYCSSVLGMRLRRARRNTKYSCSDGYGNGKSAGSKTSTSRQVTNGLYLKGQ